MSEMTKNQEKLRQLRETTPSKRRKVHAASGPGGHGVRGAADRKGGRAEGGQRREMLQRLRQAQGGPAGQPPAGGDRRQRMAQTLKDKRDGVTRTPGRPGQGDGAQGQREHLIQMFRERRADTQRGVGPVGNQTPRGRYLGEYDSRQDESPQQQMKRKMMRGKLLQEFKAKKQAADKAREEHTQRSTTEAAQNMGILFDDASKPTISSSLADIEKYYDQLAIRADWLKATLEEIRMEMKMLAQMKQSAVINDADAVVDHHHHPGQLDDGETGEGPGAK